MMFKRQQNGLVVFRATLIIKSVAVLAMLLVALLLQDRRGQALMVWPVVVVLLMLVVFGTSWFEARWGARFFPLALAAAIVLQTLELALYRPATTLSDLSPNLFTRFAPIEPFLFLLVPVALAAWQYRARGALLAAGGAGLLYAGITLAAGPEQIDVIVLLTHVLILAIVAGGAMLLALHFRSHGMPANAAEPGAGPELALSRDAHEKLVVLLSGLDTRIDALYDEFDDGSDDLRQELAQLKLTAADALAVVTVPRRSMPLCARSLIEALYEYADGFRQRTGVAVALQLKLAPDSLQPDQAETAFKIVEEALDGVASNACAQASVSLLSSDSHVALSVHSANPTAALDDGTALASEVRLLSLHRRAESVGGILCVSQQPQQGTTVACVFPRSTTHA
jgi:signal transduction histidine kinase